ncbi:MAG TPA: substrate-binding domain-containing protein [Bryobacteraceae bacterium]|nr:substrate-binding domain-containing protein [Bryobacteraceae bacterium]
MKTNSRQELILGILICLEIALFAATGQNFFSANNFFECIRLAVEIGLLALALTPVIITGGIDLSVGSMMGLCAVSFGALWHDAHLPVAAAILLTLFISLLGGGINAALISRLHVSPLIVTLGTYSLFRGLAEAITMGARNYSGFPAGFLFIGQGYLGGLVPTQTIFLLLAAAGFWILVQRTAAGRGLYAIGHSAAGARYAAIPVTKRIALVYLLSGFAAGLAAIVYVAHLGQAKSDAGTGYELIAITAVVLGGTSIFGGSGTIAGTFLGLTAIVILQNGLRLSGWPAELAGISTGVLLVVTIAMERFAKEREKLPRPRLLAVSAAVFVLAILVPLIQHHSPAASTPANAAQGKRVTIGVMPKAKGDPYFISCRVGAEEAARSLNVDLIWDGPGGLDAAKQNEVIEGWITRRVDAISVSVENGPGISTVLRKARAQGIKVVTWDADAEADARDYFINQATPQAIGNALIDEAARVMHDQGELAIITGALSAANQNIWISFMRQRIAENHPQLKLVAIRPSDDDRDKAFSETQTLLKVYPNIKVIAGISAPAVPGAGEAVKQSGRRDVKVIGLSLPNLCKPYVHAGVMEAVVLWNTGDLGYLAVAAPAALARDTLRQGQGSFNAQRLGTVKIMGSEIILGLPTIFRKDNIDLFNF